MVTVASRLLEVVQDSSSESLAHSGDPCLEMPGCSGEVLLCLGTLRLSAVWHSSHLPCSLGELEAWLV